MCSDTLEKELSIVPQKAFGLGYNAIETIDPWRKNKTWSTRNVISNKTCSCLWEEPLNTWEKEGNKTVCNLVTTELEMETTLDNVLGFHLL